VAGDASGAAGLEDHPRRRPVVLFGEGNVVEGGAVLWVLVPVGVLVVAGVIAFLFGPTIKTLFGPDFEPAPRDDASVDEAATTGIRRRRRRQATPRF
jgi:hypothetical protein